MHILKLVWLGRGRQGYSFWVFLKSVGLNGQKPCSLSLSFSLSLIDPGDAGPTLDPMWREAYSRSQSPMLGRVPPWASISGTP